MLPPEVAVSAFSLDSVRTMRKRLAVLAFCVLVQGCYGSRPEHPTFGESPEPPQTAELATIYSYFWGRPGSTIAFYLDGAKWYDAYRDTFSWIQVSPGEHTVRAQVDLFAMDLAASAKNSTANQPVEISMRFEAGKTYYLKLIPKGRVTGSRAAVTSGVVTMDSEYTEFEKRLEVVPEDEGRRLLRGAVYIPSVHSVRR